MDVDVDLTLSSHRDPRLKPAKYKDLYGNLYLVTIGN